MKDILNDITCFLFKHKSCGEVNTSTSGKSFSRCVRCKKDLILVGRTWVTCK